MVLLADDDGSTALPVRLRHQLLNALHVGTGGVHTLDAHFRQTVKDLLALAMGADDDRIAGADLLHAVHTAATQLLQFPHHVGIVDDAAQHHAAALFPCGLLRQTHGAFHTVAESGALCLNDSHCTPPSS